MSKETIFFVEDDQNIYELIEATLSVNEYKVKGFYEPLEMLEEIKNKKPDLIVLDLMLPNMSGYDVIKLLKADHLYEDIPIIILSAKSTEIDIVKGLDLGASDYITKPFGILEFSSRIKTNLRKGSHKIYDGNIIKIKNLVIDDSKHKCLIDNNVIDLTLTEYQILKLLMENVSQVMTRTKLLNIVWGYDHLAETRTLDMHIRSIREKLSHFTNEQFIETIRGVGYIING